LILNRLKVDLNTPLKKFKKFEKLKAAAERLL